MNYPKTKFDFLKNNFITYFLINLYIKMRINIFRQNGNLKLDYTWKRRSYKLRALNYNLIKNNSSDNRHFKTKVKEFLMSNFKGYRDTSWSTFYSSINGVYDHRYIPEDIYYDIIEHALNEIPLVLAYDDKNMLERIYKNVRMPQTVFRVISGRFYDKDYQSIDIEKVKSMCDPDEILVLKPSIDSGGGKNVMVDKQSNLVKYLLKLSNGLTQKKGVDFIAQYVFEQHEQIAKFHPPSVNTFRIMTLRLEDEIIPVSSFLRMGCDGSKIDNISSGGISCGINEEGYLNKYAYDIYFKRFEAHPTTNKKFKGEQIPLFKKAIELSKKLHSQLFYFDLVSWDITIGKDGFAYMIEQNLNFQGFNEHQASNGPLFKEYTDAVIERLNL